MLACLSMWFKWTFRCMHDKLAPELNADKFCDIYCRLTVFLGVSNILSTIFKVSIPILLRKQWIMEHWSLLDGIKTVFMHAKDVSSCYSNTFVWGFIIFYTIIARQLIFNCSLSHLNADFLTHLWGQSHSVPSRPLSLCVSLLQADVSNRLWNGYLWFDTD